MIIMYSIIPLQATPNHTFFCTIPVDGANITLTFRLTYNELAKYFLVDLSNEEGTMLISALPVIPAQNILEQFTYMGIGSAYVLPKTQVKEQWPTMDTLESDWYLMWSDTHAGR